MTIRTWLTPLAVAALLVTVPGAAARADPAPGPALDLELLPPSGPFPVGTRDLHLIDRDRADPWAPERRRELMVTLWYPAADDRGPIAPYATAEESTLIMDLIGTPPQIPRDLLTEVRAHGHADATPRGGRWPVVVLSPGFSFPRSSLTGLAEDLASRGYLVAGVDHTYEAAAITFPDGRVTTCLVCDLAEQGTVTGDRIGLSRAADVSFVLDELAERRAPRADLTRVAVAGHSMGGNAAAQTMLRDRRVDAGVNLDGGFVPRLSGPLDRPFLMLGSEDNVPGGAATSWDATWPLLTGWKRWLTVAGTTHSSLTDYGLLSDRAGIALQTLPGERCAEIAADYVGQFVGHHLSARPAPLLRGPDPAHPEVLFWP